MRNKLLTNPKRNYTLSDRKIVVLSPGIVGGLLCQKKFINTAEAVILAVLYGTLPPIMARLLPLLHRQHQKMPANSYAGKVKMDITMY